MSLIVFVVTVSWLVMQRYVVDGNFTAQHMNMKTPEEDVSLTDGEGYMVMEGPYQAHLKESVEGKDVSHFLTTVQVTG
jgi:hypothetical protein